MAEEITGSNTSTHAIGEGNSSTRVFHVPWAQRLVVAEQLLGSAHPEIPFCWCSRVEISQFPSEPKGYGGDIDPLSKAISYDVARLTAHYSTDFSLASQWPTKITKPSVRQNTTLQISQRASGEFMRFPARSARWTDNTQGYPSGPVPESDSAAGRFLVRMQEITLTWNYVDDPPTDRLDGLQGCVNKDEFLSKAAGTLLFAGYELAEGTKAQITDPGCWTVRVTLQLREVKVGDSSYGWNYEYRGEDGWKKVMMHDGTGWGPRYAEKTFAEMFT